MSPDTGVLLSTLSESVVRSILVVEDEEHIRMILAEFFEDSGYHVMEASNVAEAKHILAETAVDLVFSDINMPGRETGFVLEKWIRQHYPGTKVLLTSGYPQAAADTRDLAEPLVPKPYSCSAVVQHVERILRAEPSSGRNRHAAAAQTEKTPCPDDHYVRSIPKRSWPTAQYAR